MTLLFNEKALQEIDSLIANPMSFPENLIQKLFIRAAPSSIIGDTEFTKNHGDCLIPQSAAILPQDRNQIACR